MNYQTYPSHPDLSSWVSCYWTLEVPAESDPQKQRIVPDGCIEMAFILGDDVRRYTSETEFILQPRSMVLGQTIRPFLIQPTGYVNTFAIRFYPYGFSSFVDVPIERLANKETPIHELFDNDLAKELEVQVTRAASTEERIEIIDRFLLDRLSEKRTIDRIVINAVDTLLAMKGNAAVGHIANADLVTQRQLQRKFLKQVGIGPKQLGKVIRFRSALKRILDRNTGTLTDIAYEADYYDQAHFIKDFKEYTGTTPKQFLNTESLGLSALFYK